ncbi:MULTISPECIES: protein kinase domain-containing protein [unclassified Mycolicibacterium]|uniref:protein kinase domain-containing protein n=1 Tax=unclassified Mycolicibacterium TaxID=2636767 RepID=UPI002ED8DD66
MADNSDATRRESDVAVELFTAGFDDVAEIGRGGFGVVFRCLESELDRIVAVKLLTADLDADTLARFLREQRALGRLSGHPNIVDIHRVGVTESKRPFLVMPYRGRGSLDRHVRANGPLNWPEVLKTGIKIAGALETAHRAGTLHRDVKPANILITDYDEVQLCDFGIAHIGDGFVTRPGTVMCSPAYTAPEVLAGGSSTTASDIYSLGATLFCALTGHAAFERHSGEQIVGQFVRMTARPVPDLRRSGVPTELCAAIEHAMARAAEDRPASVAAFGEELRDIQRGNALAVDDMYVASAAQARDLPDGTMRPAVTPSPRTSLGRTPPTPLTKFRPPSSSRPLVRRQRLIDLLRQGEGRRLTLIHGPAGFGKSTLLAQWRDQLVDEGMAVAWLTVDRDDNNVVWFLAHLVDALRRADVDVVDGLRQALEENGQPAGRFVLSSLINRVHEGDRPVVLVVDDWHVVTAAESHGALEFLLGAGCHHLRLVVGSRSKAGLPLSRMRVSDELCEIDSASLSFDLAEAHDFFAGRLDAPIAGPDVEKLRTATGGWVAALQLASLSLRGTQAPVEVLERLESETDPLGEYLTDNVLDGLSAGMLDFLLATSVPARVCGDLASSLAGIRDGHTELERVVASDLFLARAEDDRQWYRYHQLFRSILLQRLGREHPELLEDLHRSAARWFEKRGLLSEALGHLLAVGDSAQAVGLLEAHSLNLLDRSQMSTLLGMVNKLPADRVLESLRLQLAIGWANTELERRDIADEAWLRARQLLRNGCGVPAEHLARFRVEADVLKACILSAADRVTGVKELLAECLATPAAHEPFVVSMAALLDTIADVFEYRFADAVRRQEWAIPYHAMTTGPYSVAYGYCYAGMARAEQLDLIGATELYGKAFRLALDAGNGQSQYGHLARVLLAEARYLQDRVSEAEGLLDASFDVAVFGGSPDFMVRHYCVGARIRALRGNSRGAVEILDEGTDVAETLNLPRLAAAVNLERVRLGFSPIDASLGIARDIGRPPTDGVEQITRELREEAAIWQLLSSKDPQSLRLACDWANERRQALGGSGRAMAELCATRMQVACLWAADRRDDAEQLLLGPLAMCARTGMIRFLSDGGEHVAGALGELRRRIDEPVFHAVRTMVPFLDAALKAVH